MDETPSTSSSRESSGCGAIFLCSRCDLSGGGGFAILVSNRLEDGLGLKEHSNGLCQSNFYRTGIITGIDY